MAGIPVFGAPSSEMFMRAAGVGQPTGWDIAGDIISNAANTFIELRKQQEIMRMRQEQIRAQQQRAETDAKRQAAQEKQKQDELKANEGYRKESLDLQRRLLAVKEGEFGLKQSESPYNIAYKQSQAENMEAGTTQKLTAAQLNRLKIEKEKADAATRAQLDFNRTKISNSIRNNNLNEAFALAIDSGIPFRANDISALSKTDKQAAADAKDFNTLTGAIAGLQAQLKVYNTGEEADPYSNEGNVIKQIQSQLEDRKAKLDLLKTRYKPEQSKTFTNQDVMNNVNNLKQNNNPTANKQDEIMKWFKDYRSKYSVDQISDADLMAKIKAMLGV